MLILYFALYSFIFCEISLQKICHTDLSDPAEDLASILTGRTLDISDLDKTIALLERHHFSKASYHELGLRLKLSYDTLEIIKKSYKEDVRSRFSECLASWLRKADDSVENPTIDTLIAALRGIGENAVADGITGERKIGVVSRSEILISHTLIIFSQGCDPTQSPIVNPGVHDLEHKIDQVSMLRDIANKLLNKFGHLVVAVKNALERNRIDVNNAKEFVKEHLKRKARVAPNLMPCIDILKNVKDFKSFFDFLGDYDFIGYLNYMLLKKLSELVDDNKLKQRFFEYEKEYAKLLSAGSFKDLIPLFEKQSDLSPTAPLGLPYISFHLEKPWLITSVYTWISTFGEFSWAQYAIFKELRENCVIITYAILPCILDDVMRDLKDPVILKKLEDKGVTVIELPQEEKVADVKGIPVKKKRKQKSRKAANQKINFQQMEILDSSDHIVKIKLWQLWIIIVIVLCLIVSAMVVRLCHFVKGKRKWQRSRRIKPNVYDADYHNICKSLTHLSRHYETSKKAYTDLREEARKLKNQVRDKDSTLDQITKKYTDLKKELYVKEKKLKHESEIIATRMTENKMRSKEEIYELKHKLHEAEIKLLSMNSSSEEELQQLSDLRIEKELEENIEAYKNEVASLEDKLAKRNEAIVSLEDHLSAKHLELSQLQEELTASKSKATSLEETLNIKEQEIRQHMEVLKIETERGMSGSDDLCIIHNESLIEASQTTVHLKRLPPPQLVVCSAPVFECNNGYSLEGSDICELSERDDISPMEFIPYSLKILKYQNQLVVSPVFLPFLPSPPPLIESHLMPK